MSARPEPRAFRRRLLAREPLLGTFMKSPGSHNTEVIANLGFDFVMLDQEHAPWERSTLDVGLLAARAFGAAGFVRIARSDAANILAVLDDGAIGFMAPHVDSAEKARSIVSWAHYKGGTRGAGVGRGGEYGANGANNKTIADETTTVIAMIEDREALDVIDEIVAVPGIDCIFLGRGDLALSLSNAEGPAPTINEAVEQVAAACKRHNKPLSALVQSMKSAEAKWLIDLGVTAMMVSTDHGFMAEAATKALSEFRETMPAK